MRKILLATASASVLCTFAMQAQAQMTVSLGGYTEFFGGLFNDELGANRNKRDFELETEIVVKADGKADNGLLYGAKIELQNGATRPDGTFTTGIITDEASIYVGGQWGRFELGDFDGAADTLKIYAPVVGVEQIDGDYTDFAGGQPNFGMHIPNSGDSTKIMYLTPRFAGFQGGASYTPEAGDEGQSVVQLKNTSTYKDVGEFGVNYTGEFSGFSVALGATASTATGQDLGTVGGPSLEDFFAWQAGAQVGYGGFMVGGGYIDADDYNAVSGAPATSGDSTAWHVGASYTAGPVAIGLTYADAEGFKDGPDVSTGLPSTYASSYKTYGGGVAYTIAAGLTVQADVMYVDEDLRNVDALGGVSTASNEGIVAVFSTRLDF